MTAFPFNRRALVVPILFSLLPSAGCLEGRVHEAVRYDAKRDTFGYLHLYKDIAGSNAGELEHLNYLWRNRENVLIYPEGNWLHGLGPYPAALRVTKNSFKPIKLGEPAESEPLLKAAKIDLSRIQIMPGEMFLSKDATLCCYHEIEVPGAIVDSVLSSLSKKVSDSVIAGVSKELGRRGRDNRLGVWDDARLQVLTAITSDPASSTTPSDSQVGKAAASEDEDDPKVAYPLSCLDESSLRQLLKAAADSAVRLDRIGSIFRLTFPLSMRDCQQAKATIDAMKGAKITMLRKDADVSQSALRAAESIKVQILEGPELQIGIDIGTYLCPDNQRSLESDPEPKKAVLYRATVASVEGRGITIRKDLTIPQVMDHFANRQK